MVSDDEAEVDEKPKYTGDGGGLLDGKLVGFVLARSCVSASFALVTLTSPQLLLDINGNKLDGKVQRIRTMLETSATLIGFVTQPIVGGLIDAYGRKPALVLGPILSACSRMIVIAKPNNGTYVLYRILNMLALMPLMQASTAYLADRLGGRGSEQYVEVNRKMFMLLALVRMGFVRWAARIKDPARCFKLSSALNVMAGCLFLFSVEESLQAKEKRPFVFHRAGNPFSFVDFFSRTPQLRWAAIVLLFTNASMYNGAMDQYRRKKFGWTIKENAKMVQLFNLTEILSPLIAVPIFKRLGAQTTFIAQQLVSVACNLDTAFTTNPSTLYFHPIVNSIFDAGAAFDQILATASRSVDTGQGQLSAALSNLSFPLGMTFPTIFSELYVYSMSSSSPMLRGTFSFLLCASIQFINATVLIPGAFASLKNQPPPSSS